MRGCTTFGQHKGHEHDQIFAAFVSGIVRVVPGIHEDAARRIYFTGASKIITMINSQVSRYDCCPQRTTMLMPAEYTTGSDCVADHGNL